MLFVPKMAALIVDEIWRRRITSGLGTMELGFAVKSKTISGRY